MTAGRKGKQLCIIAVSGEPCGGCIARSLDCTFDLPPLRRHLRSEANDDTRSAGQGQETTEVPVTGPPPSASLANNGILGSRSIDSDQRASLVTQAPHREHETSPLHQQPETLNPGMFPEWHSSETAPQVRKGYMGHLR